MFFSIQRYLSSHITVYCIWTDIIQCLYSNLLLRCCVNIKKVPHAENWEPNLNDTTKNLGFFCLFFENNKCFIKLTGWSSPCLSRVWNVSTGQKKYKEATKSKKESEISVNIKVKILKIWLQHVGQKCCENGMLSLS